MDINNNEDDLSSMEGDNMEMVQQQQDSNINNKDNLVEILQNLLQKGLSTAKSTATIDNNIIAHMGMRSFTLYTTRCTLKVSFMAGEDMVTNCIKANKAIFKQIKQVLDNKAFITSWYENDKDSDNIVNVS